MVSRPSRHPRTRPLRWPPPPRRMKALVTWCLQGKTLVIHRENFPLYRLAYVDAQNKCAEKDRTGQLDQRFFSQPGKQDGFIGRHSKGSSKARLANWSLR